MNKREVEKLIPSAMKELKKYLNKDNKIPKEYGGYISSLGASIVQSGLISTVAFFEAKESGAKEDRSKLTKLILKIIYDEKQVNEENRKENLLDYVIENENQINVIKEDVINATIAIKLAIRVYEFTK